MIGNNSCATRSYLVYMLGFTGNFTQHQFGYSNDFYFPKQLEWWIYIYIYIYIYDIWNTAQVGRTKRFIARSWSNLVNKPEGWVHQVWPSWVQKREYYTSVQNEEVYCTKLVKPGERTRRVSSPGLSKLRAINFFVLYMSVVLLLSYAILGNNPQKKILVSPFCYFSMHINRLTFNLYVCVFLIAAYWNKM